MRWRNVVVTVMMAGGLLLATGPGDAPAQPPVAPPLGKPGQPPPAPVSGTPGRPPSPAPSGGHAQPAPGIPGGGHPGVPPPVREQPAPAPPPRKGPSGPKGWNLSDVVEGLIAMESAGLPLSPAQVRRIRPALRHMLESMRRMDAAEARLPQLLTPSQKAFVQKEGNSALPDDDTPSTAKESSRDPVVTRALRILERRAR